MQTQPLIIPDRTLEPSWELKRAREPGFLRSLTTWVGGPEGYINSNPDRSAISAACAVGLMRMPTGNRQPGVHVHSVTEIYVILKGEVESFDGVGNVHRAGPLDCLYIPAGVPHGVRAIGPDDLELIWIHDAIERMGVSTYLEGEGPFPADREVSLVRYADIADISDGPAWWVALPDAAGARDAAAPNRRVGVGVNLIAAGAGLVGGAAPRDRVGIVLDGRATVFAGGARVELGPLDGLHLPAGVDPAMTNAAALPLRLLWVDEAGSEPTP